MSSSALSRLIVVGEGNVAFGGGGGRISRGGRRRGESGVRRLRVIPDSLIYLLVTVRAVPAESAPRGNKFARSTTSCGFWLPEMMGLIVDVILVDLISCVRIFHCVRPWLLVR